MAEANRATTLAAQASKPVTTTGGIVGKVPVFTGAAAIGDSLIFQNASGIGIGAAPASAFDVTGRSTFRGVGALVAPKAATASSGVNSSPLELDASVFDSAAGKATTPYFQLMAEPTNNNTNHSGANLHLLYNPGFGGPRESGLWFNANGTINSHRLRSSPSLLVLLARPVPSARLAQQAPQVRLGREER